MKKVYCKNCNNFKGRITYCTCYFLKKSDPYLKDTPFEIELIENNEFAQPRKDNKNNDCKYYERKWWKFWS